MNWPLHDKQIFCMHSGPKSKNGLEVRNEDDRKYKVERKVGYSVCDHFFICECCRRFHSIYSEILRHFCDKKNNSLIPSTFGLKAQIGRFNLRSTKWPMIEFTQHVTSTVPIHFSGVPSCRFLARAL